MNRYFKRKANRKKARQRSAKDSLPSAIYVNAHRRSKENIEKIIGLSSDAFDEFNVLTTDDIKTDDIKVESYQDSTRPRRKESLRDRLARQPLAIAATVLGLAAVGSAALWIRVAL